MRHRSSQNEDLWIDRMAESLEALEEMLVLAEERYLQRSLRPTVFVEAQGGEPDVEILDDRQAVSPRSAIAPAFPDRPIRAGELE